MVHEHILSHVQTVKRRHESKYFTHGHREHRPWYHDTWHLTQHCRSHLHMHNWPDWHWRRLGDCLQDPAIWTGQSNLRVLAINLPLFWVPEECWKLLLYPQRLGSKPWVHLIDVKTFNAAMIWSKLNFNEHLIKRFHGTINSGIFQVTFQRKWCVATTTRLLIQYTYCISKSAW